MVYCLLLAVVAAFRVAAMFPMRWHLAVVDGAGLYAVMRFFPFPSIYAFNTDMHGELTLCSALSATGEAALRNGAGFTSRNRSSTELPTWARSNDAASQRRGRSQAISFKRRSTALQEMVGSCTALQEMMAACALGSDRALLISAHLWGACPCAAVVRWRCTRRT